ncbi:hypothetical protein GH714_031864 [Hevea brasiliensis]|uniref:MTHFR SAM-binding regulatory domain-containing protein n=1 Tax=Hevea brasiliensis TaxID=3981 RepID=A0A6A6NK38_HEVBR|nr:hypothetical protein GH714_031864 [Hevea brasiliensis]
MRGHSASPSRWGGPEGYVYQKAYLEFFCSTDKLQVLVDKCKSFPPITYVAVNKGGTLVSNVGPNDVNVMQSRHLLVSLVDNDYIDGDIFAAFADL